MEETKKIVIPINLPGMTLLESSANDPYNQNYESEAQIGGELADDIIHDAPYAPIFDNKNKSDPTDLDLLESFSIDKEKIPDLPTINKVVKTPKKTLSLTPKNRRVEKIQTSKSNNNNKKTKDSPNKDSPNKDTPNKDIPNKDSPNKDIPNKDSPNKHKSKKDKKEFYKSKILLQTKRNKFEIMKNKPFIKRTKDGFCYFAGPIKDSMELYRNKKASSKLKYKAISPKSMNLTKKYKRILITLPSKKSLRSKFNKYRQQQTAISHMSVPNQIKLAQDRGLIRSENPPVELVHVLLGMASS